MFISKLILSAMFCTAFLYQLAGKGELVIAQLADFQPRSRTQNTVAPATAAGIIRIFSPGTSRAA